MLEKRNGLHERLFQYFKESAEQDLLPPDKRRIRLEWKGLYYGEEMLSIYADWRALEYDVMGMFGMPMIELPPKFRHDLITLKKMDMWHQWNAKLTKKTALLEASSPLRRVVNRLTGQNG